MAERLRTDSREAHAAAEAAFDLPRRLASERAYAGVVIVMESFHRACAPALAAVAADLPLALRDGPRRRRARLRADLQRLGRAPAVIPPAPGPAAGPDAGLGAWYVLEGASLGGLVIAAEARRRLPAVAPATTFFAGEGRATAARWRAFQAVLAGWEARGDGAADCVVSGALTTFGALRARLEAEA